MTSISNTVFRLLSMVAVALVLAANLSPVSAQNSIEPPDYALWEQTVNRAQEAIDAGRASNAALEELRSQLVAWRLEFQKAQGVNSNAIATVASQISALGPVPEEGGEAFEIAQQRQALTLRQNTLESPVKAAEVAYSRADGLIRGIDEIIRERKADALLQIGPSPVDPTNWSAGYSALSGLIHSIQVEFRTAYDSPVQSAEMNKDLPFTIFLVLVGLVLLLRGRRLAEKWAHAVQESQATAQRWLLAFGLSLGQMGLPFLGLIFLIEAVYSTGLVGLRGDIFLSALPTAGMVLLASRWLGARMFSRSESADAPLKLGQAKRREGRLYAGLIGLVVAIRLLIVEMSGFDNWTENARVVILFVPVVLVALLLFRMSRLLLIHSQHDTDSEDERGYRSRLGYILARALLVVSVISPALATIGYFQAAV
ncbi:MAG: DUF3772 domain-containing protein, partial [Rhodobacterales bacterium]|nr:DUF3772 domain-containing protein [Rhodobacterales bacterium]